MISCPDPGILHLIASYLLLLYLMLQKQTSEFVAIFWQISHGKEERWCGNASWHGKNSPTTSQSSGDMHRARLEILSSNIGDAYYGHKHQIVERMPQRALPRDEQAVFLQVCLRM